MGSAALVRVSGDAGFIGDGFRDQAEENEVSCSSQEGSVLKQTNDTPRASVNHWDFCPLLVLKFCQWTRSWTYTLLP